MRNETFKALADGFALAALVGLGMAIYGAPWQVVAGVFAVPAVIVTLWAVIGDWLERRFMPDDEPTAAMIRELGKRGER